MIDDVKRRVSNAFERLRLELEGIDFNEDSPETIRAKVEATRAKVDEERAIAVDAVERLRSHGR